MVNDRAIVPMTVTAGNATYPTLDEILVTLQQATSDIALIPGVAIAQELGNARANNVVLLGVLSRWLDVDEAIWKEVVAGRLPPKYRPALKKHGKD